MQVAGQRVQIIKPDSGRGGLLEFGTELVAAADRSLVALLGASPGASTAAFIAKSVLEKCFPNELRDAAWLSKLKAIIPGGSSVPVLTASECEGVTLDYEALLKAGSMLGSGGVIVFNDTVKMPEVLSVIADFYAHESCGQCTPCREGTGWAAKILRNLIAGKGKVPDIDLLYKIADMMEGKTICPLADADVMPIRSFVTKFRSEFESFCSS